MRRVLQERMARGFATSLDRFADGLLPIRASGTAVELEGWAWIDFAAVDQEPEDALQRALYGAQEVLMHATAEQWPAPDAEPEARVEGEFARLWFERPSGPGLELLPVWLTPGIEGVAQLLEGRFRLRVGDRATWRIDADFELIMRMPEGQAERWRFDWNLQDMNIGHLDPDCDHRAEFDFFMRSLFDDHMYDLRETGLRPDRDYDDVPMALEIPSEVFDGA